MKVIEASLSSQSSFLKDYLNGSKKSKRFFDYTYADQHGFKRRADELRLRSFQREALAAYFTDVHQRLPYSEEAALQIDKLKDERAVVVVGGQQAGLLTGPLYTVYKAMSIIGLAKEQEQKLGIPVVPIFWIAGEDHDLDEIRFVYKEKNGRWQKHLFADKVEANSASNVLLDKQKINQWIREVFASLPETAHTAQLLKKTDEFVSQSTTYVDFFIRMMNWLLGHEGLLLLDAHAPAIRCLEIGYFERLINEVEHIQFAQQCGGAAFSSEGYGEPIETDALNAHLFLQINEERKRLDYEAGMFTVRGTDLSFTKEELLRLLQEKPEWFSNNVVTRPLMQEWLLPVLAFISGPGELLYWATLKDVFAHFHLNVPPVVPRMQATFVPAQVGKWLAESDYEIEPFLSGRMEELREEWFNKVNTYPVLDVVEKTKERVYEAHKDMRALAKEIDPLLAVLSEKNAVIIGKQLEFLGKKMEHFIRQQHEHYLSKFTEAGHWLHPLNLPQERVFHPILLINLIGIEQFQRFLSENKTPVIGHKVVYL